jgi:hypothetical protein
LCDLDWCRELTPGVALSVQAKSLINEGVETDPYNPYLWLLKGKMFSDAGHTHAARSCFENGLKMNPRFLGILNVRHPFPFPQLYKMK